MNPEKAEVFMTTVLKSIEITDIAGFSIGQCEDEKKATGVTVILTGEKVQYAALMYGEAVRPAGKMRFSIRWQPMMQCMPLFFQAVLLSDWKAAAAPCAG